MFILGLAALGVLTAQCVKQSADLSGVQVYSNLGHAHTAAPVQYAQIPPVGGDHSPTLLNCGIYDQPVPNENAVHSLEHGAVWITYQPTLRQADVAKLRQLVQGRDHLILSPYPDLQDPVVASGWGVQLKLRGADDPRLPRFIEKYVNGSQAGEPGGPCSGGIGSPIAR
jgi:hypothetical protein